MRWLWWTPLCCNLQQSCLHLFFFITILATYFLLRLYQGPNTGIYTPLWIVRTRFLNYQESTKQRTKQRMAGTLVYLNLTRTTFFFIIFALFVAFCEGMRWGHPFCLFCWATQLEAADFQFDIEGEWSLRPFVSHCLQTMETRLKSRGNILGSIKNKFYYLPSAIEQFNQSFLRFL